MPSVVNKTFDELKPGDTACVQRTVQAADLRAWACALGDPDLLAGAGESQGTAGIVTAILTALVGSAIRASTVQVKADLPLGVALTVRLLLREKHAPGLVLLDGQCTGSLLSHCATVSVPTYARRFVVTDAALNIAPDTDQKRDICQNAIGFARALGTPVPKVAVLAAVEMVRTKMPASLDPGARSQHPQSANRGVIGHPRRHRDALVFTAGIGEHSAPVRAGLCGALGRLGWPGTGRRRPARARASRPRPAGCRGGSPLPIEG